MGQTVYVDLYFLINFSMDFLCFFLTAKLLDRRLGIGRGLIGAALGGLAVMMGHVYPILLGGRGGKGILSGLFVDLVLDWRIAIVLLIVFFGTYFLTHYVSLGSVLAAASFGICFAVLHYDNLVVMICGIVMSLTAIFMHRSNIARLIKGTESKTNLFGEGKKNQ